MGKSRWQEDSEPIHLWFNLTYANYLVVPRSVLQSMPQPWQAKFCELLEEMHEAFGHLDWPHYNVRCLAREPEFMTISPQCEECDDGVVVEDGEEIDCPVCDGAGELIDQVEDHRYETPEEVGFRHDPIPHYDRGRTHLEPRTPVA